MEPMRLRSSALLAPLETSTRSFLARFPRALVLTLPRATSVCIFCIFLSQNSLELQNISLFERQCFTTRETLNRNFRSCSFLEQTMLTSTRQTHHLCAGEHPQDP